MRADQGRWLPPTWARWEGGGARGRIRAGPNLSFARTVHLRAGPVPPVPRSRPDIGLTRRFRRRPKPFLRPLLPSPTRHPPLFPPRYLPGARKNPPQAPSHPSPPRFDSTHLFLPHRYRIDAATPTTPQTFPSPLPSLSALVRLHPPLSPRLGTHLEHGRIHLGPRAPLSALARLHPHRTPPRYRPAPSGEGPRVGSVS